MPVKIWLPWKHKDPRPLTCHIKLFPILGNVAKFGRGGLKSTPLPIVNRVKTRCISLDAVPLKFRFSGLGNIKETL